MISRALIIGASGAVGESAARWLIEAGWAVRASVRDLDGAPAKRLRALGCEIIALDLEQQIPPDALQDVSAAIATPILSLSINALDALAHLDKRVFFSSNNVGLDPQSPIYKNLAACEARVRADAPQSIIIRPTLIYGDPRLRTVAQLMTWARRFPILPLPGSGRALTQPVFFDDLGRAAALACTSDVPAGTYALGGPDVVTMREFYNAILAASGSSALVAPIPTFMLQFGRFALGARFPFTPAQIARTELHRLARSPDAIPDALAPRTSLADGLARLAS